MTVGTVHEYGSPEYNRLIPTTSRKPGSRAAIVIDIYQVGAVRNRLHCIRQSLIGSNPVHPNFVPSSVMRICSPAVRLRHASHTAPPDV